MPIDADSTQQDSAEPIVFELLADATEFVDLAYQPVCRVGYESLSA